MPTPLLLTLQDAPAGEPVQGQPAPGPAQRPTGGLFGDGAFSFLPLILIFAIFYFVLIAPERKNRKRRESMLSAIKKGDRVMTTGGMHATVASVQGDVLTLQVADGVRVRFTRAAVQSIVEDEGAGTETKKD